MPLVTIVMPAYNVEQYISASIDSVLSQTWNHWELIIVNDGSSDNTLKKIEKYAAVDKRITIVTQRNSGVAVARNTGLERAKGDYISFLDADDIYAPTYIEKMVLGLIANSASFAFCKFKKVLGDRVLSETPSNTPSYTNFPNYLLGVKRHAYAAMATMFLKKVITENKLQFTEGCILGEDSEFVLKVASLGKTVFISEYLYFYVYRADSASHQDITYQHIFDHYDSYERAKVFISNFSNSPVKELYIKHIERCQNSVLNNLRRRIWSDIQNNNFSVADSALNRYGKPLKVRNSNFFQSIVNSLKLSVINSQKHWLWKLVSKKNK